MRLLRQPQYHPYSQHEQVIILVAALAHCFQQVPMKKIADCCKDMLNSFNHGKRQLCARIESTGELTDEDREAIVTAAKEFVTAYLKTK